MRHRIPAVLATLLFALLLAAPAQAAAPNRHKVPRLSNAKVTQQRMITHLLSGTRFIAPLDRLALGAAMLNGHVYDFYGNPQSGATVEADVPVDASTWDYQTTTTDGLGAYSLSNLTAATANGELWTMPQDNYLLAQFGLSWTDPGPTTFDVRPGATSVTLYRGGPWHSDDHPAWNWNWATVNLHGTSQFSSSGVNDSYGGTNPVTGSAYALPGHQSLATVNFWYDEGVEVPVSIDTVAGAASDSVTADQAVAMRAITTKPYWGSGKPGTAVRVKMANFPVGWITDFSGYSYSPGVVTTKEFGSFTTTSTSAQSKTVTIPRTAKPGYDYWIGLDHQGGGLYLETPIQVCTFKSSRTSVSRGTAVRLSGVVPTEGHWGSTAGKRKYVTIYTAKYGKAVPTWWNPVGHGWYKLITVRTDGYGRFHTPLMKPYGSNTVIARYNGDNWFWGAFTSTVKISVH